MTWDIPFLIFDIGGNRGQRHATSSFLKIDMRHGDPPSRAPPAIGDQQINPVERKWADCNLCLRTYFSHVLHTGEQLGKLC